MFCCCRKDSEVSAEGRLGAQNKHLIILTVAAVSAQVGSGELPGGAAQHSFGQAGFLQNLSV